MSEDELRRQIYDKHGLSNHFFDEVRPTTTPRTWLDEAAPEPLHYSIDDIISESNNIFDEIFGRMVSQIENTTAIKPTKPKDDRMEEVQYVQSLAARTGRALSADQINKLAGLGERNAINKAFFEMPASEVVQAVPNEGASKLESVMAEVQTAMDKAISDRAASRLRAIDGEITQLRGNAESYLSQAQNYFTEIGKRYTELSVLDGTKKIDFKVMLAKILENPFYTFVDHSHYYGSVSFKTNDVILRYVNHEQGINATLNFGQFKATWYYKDNKIRVSGYENNIEGLAYLHPHVSGEVCWGNAKDAYLKAMASMDIPTVFSLLQAVLHQYNPDSPFVDIGRFIIAQNPESVDPKDTHYSHIDTVFVFKNAIEHSVEIFDEMDSQDGEPLIQIRIYQKYHSRFGILLGNARFYKTKNNKYIELKDEAFV